MSAYRMRWPSTLPASDRAVRSLAVIALVISTACPGATRADDVLVFAAASLKPALDDILATPEAKAAGRVATSYAASSQLARQIEHGAPAALFISADIDWMDHLDRRELIDRESRSDLIGNTLVLVAPSDSTLAFKIANTAAFVIALGDEGLLAIAEPNSVPAGKYAKAALASLGLWSAVEQRVVAAVNVRAALGFVVRREVPLGIVYGSDAVSEPAVRVVDAFPDETHPAIVYPVAIVRANDSPMARRVLCVLQSDAARASLLRHGFSVPVASPQRRIGPCP
jgi:molybdate transport system substrate-binding protein